MQVIFVQPVLEELPKVMEFVETGLGFSKAESKDKTRLRLLMEESFVQLAEASGGKGKLSISFTKRNGEVLFRMHCAGRKIEPVDYSDIDPELSGLGASAEAAIRQMILNANTANYSCSYRNGVNTVRVISGRTKTGNMKKMLLALLAATAFGFVLRMLPGEVSAGINSYLLTPIKTLFMSALKMIVAPLVFFSIAGSVSSFSDISQLGKIGGKVMLFYTFTTVVALALAIGVFNIMSPGTFGALEFAASEAAEVKSVDLMGTLLSVIPANFLKPFVEADTLQLIFLAILFGVAAVKMERYSSAVGEFLAAGSALFSKVAELITGILPLMIFASIASLILNTSIETIRSIGALILCDVTACLIMVAVYLILVLIVGRKNPFAFIRKAFPSWINALSLSSSNAAMSYTMEVCDKQLHIDKSLYSFSIPLGATVNMDGLSILLGISTLFFAKMCGVTLGASDMISMGITVVVLSFGSPGLPGAAVLCISIMFQQFGIPMECVALYAAADAFLDPLCTADNVLGDVVGTYVIAARNGLIHEDEA